MPGTRAVIDVGTNSVKLLVAEVDGNAVIPLLEKSEQTRLGQGFYETHILQPEAIETTALAIRDFRFAAEAFNPECIQVFATSAARDAINKEALAEAIRRIAGLELQIISGEQEADWVFQGVTTDPVFRDQTLLVMDVGGGSSELILGRNEERSFAKSFQLGAVRLLERCRPSDPPTASELAQCRESLIGFFSKEILPSIQFVTRGMNQLKLVATGGTATILARIEYRLESFDREAIEGAKIYRRNLMETIERLWRLSLSDRQRIVGLPPKRADVILTGSLIYESVMEVFGFDLLRVSTRGLRFAAAMNCTHDPCKRVQSD